MWMALLPQPCLLSPSHPPGTHLIFSNPEPTGGKGLGPEQGQAKPSLPPTKMSIFLLVSSKRSHYLESEKETDWDHLLPHSTRQANSTGYNIRLVRVAQVWKTVAKRTVYLYSSVLLSLNPSAMWSFNSSHGNSKKTCEAEESSSQSIHDRCRVYVTGMVLMLSVKKLKYNWVNVYMSQLQNSPQ